MIQKLTEWAKGFSTGPIQKDLYLFKPLLCPRCGQEVKLVDQTPMTKGFRKKNIRSFKVEDELKCTSKKCQNHWLALQQYVFFINTRKEKRYRPRKILKNCEIIGVKMLDPCWIN